ncbi:MAG TPA: hypothetical protein VKS24_04005 [Bradyrhizobium sp.]|nr:hypothetical protein [Bradyrhizobium sp.]
MSKFAIRLLTLAAFATALAMVPMAAPAEAAHSSKHFKKRIAYRSPRISYGWSAGEAWPAARSYSPPGPVCPGLARSFDCRVWPPPFDEDPDRKVSGSDGGG